MLKRTLIICSMILPWSAACGRNPSQAPGEVTTREAKVELQSAEGSNIRGEATFREEDGGVKVTLQVHDASVGQKGVHIHQNGDCSNIPGKSMGGHFSPGDKQHALPEEAASDAHHLGDMGNIKVGDDGSGLLEFLIKNASLLKGDTRSLIGRALVVHEGMDHGMAEQPSGGSGQPIACGVIEES